MPDRKISELTELTSLAADDEFVVVDKSDLLMGPSGTTKRVTRATLDALYGGGSAALVAIAALTPANNKFAYFTSPTAAALADLTAAGRALIDDPDAATQRTTLGLGNAATKNTGSAAGTVAAGDDARLSDTRTPTDGSVTAAKVNTTLKPSGTAISTDESLRRLGTGSTHAAAGDDSRFPSAGEKNALAGSSGTPGSGNKYVTDADARNADTRTPTDGSVTAAKVAAALKPSGSAAAGDEALRALGATASTAAAGNDSRLSDTRTPTDGSVTAAKVAAALKPSGSAATTDESLRALGTTASTAAAGNHTHSDMASEATRAASGEGYVNHGATAGTARPSGYAAVKWVGSVEPTNAVNGDTWINTA